MSEWDPWKRYMREQEWRMWDPWARLEYEQRRLIEDPWFRMEKEQERLQWDPYYRMEKQMTDPVYRFEREQERMRKDPWFRQLHRMEYGLSPDQVADPIYVQEKELGLGTRPGDYMNPEYRVYMDAVKSQEEEEKIRESADFMEKFIDPEWVTMEDVKQQLKELEEKMKNGGSELAGVASKKGGVLDFIKKLFGFP